jgi:phosphotransferase system enzyme I (PtsI)
MKTLSGIAGSPGYASGYAVVAHRAGVKICAVRRHAADASAEAARLCAARASYAERLAALHEKLKRELGDEGAAIIRAYQAILEDDAFFESALECSAAKQINIEAAIEEKYLEVSAMFDMMDDPYLKERVHDIENVCGEVIRELAGVREGEIVFPEGQGDVVLVAEDLSPTQTVQLDKKRLRGFVTERGGITSHTVILAKMLGIPAIVGVKGAVSEISSGDSVLLNADKGTVTVNPDAAAVAAFETACAASATLEAAYREAELGPAVTRDGFHVDVCVNAGDRESIDRFDPERCDGVGLFRTEFLYLGVSVLPDEDTQAEVYTDIAMRAAGKEVIIRTLDIGADKRTPCLELPDEANPFLGYRGIRLCLCQTDIFREQLRAILRASVFGNVKLMFPMIVCLEELEAALEQLELAKEELTKRGVAFDKNIRAGIMVETPAAVLLSAELAQSAAFFSVGTNDLIQYTTATDRLNERVAALYDPCNLSVLRGIRMVAENAAKAGIPWGICGEAASDRLLLPLWVALGVSELSVAPSMVGAVKYRIRGMRRRELVAGLDGLLAHSRIEDVRAALSRLIRN